MKPDAENYSIYALWNGIPRNCQSIGVAMGLAGQGVAFASISHFTLLPS